jgi:hypothetical protein
MIAKDHAQKQGPSSGPSKIALCAGAAKPPGRNSRHKAARANVNLTITYIAVCFDALML